MLYSIICYNLKHSIVLFNTKVPVLTPPIYTHRVFNLNYKDKMLNK